MRSLLLLIVCLSAVKPACARENVRIRPAPDWLQETGADFSKKPVVRDIRNGFYYDLVDKQINLVSQTSYFHYIRNVVNASGVQQAAEVSAYFSPQFEQLVFHKVVIVRNGKELNQLTPDAVKVVQEESEAGNYQYNGIKRAYITLRDLRAGDRVDFSYSITGFNPVFDGRYAKAFYFSSETAITNYFLTLLTAPDAPLYFRSFNQATVPAPQTAGGFKVYHWQNPPIRTDESGPNTPSWYSDDPYVAVSAYDSWDKVVDWGLRVFNHYQYPLPAELLDRIKEWHHISAGDADLFGNLALRFVQDEVRYLGLEIGDYTHRPHTPAEVFDHRFGDCKDKALLLTAILNHEHIEAYVALVNTTEREKLAEALPAATDFDHAIVAIRRSSGYIFVDPTVSLQRGELVNAFIPAYGYALVLREGENRLEPLEPGFLYNTAITETLDARFADSSFYSVTSVYSGGAADDVRQEFSTSGQQDIDDTYTKYYATQFDSIGLLKPVEIKDDSTKNQVTVKEYYGVPHIWHSNSSGKKELSVFAKALYERIPDPATHKSGEPVAISFPQSIQFDFSLNMPLPFPGDIKPVHIRNDSYQFDFVPSEKGSRLGYHYYFKTFRDYIPDSDLAQYKADYKEINNCLSLSFTTGGFDSPASPPASATPSQLNWPLIWTAFFIGVAFTAIGRYLDRRSLSPEREMQDGWPLGGWTVVLGITLGLRIILQSYVSWEQHYFLTSTWTALGKLGGSKLQVVLVIELFTGLFSLSGAIALLYWFLKRRDIFPKLFIYYVGISLGMSLLLTLLYGMEPSLGDLQKDASVNFFRSLVYTAVWTTYVVRSERVRNTFVCPPQL